MVLLGEARIGKTSLVNRYLYDFFDKSCPDHYDATNHERSIEIGEKKIKLIIWDTCGQEKYTALN